MSATVVGKRRGSRRTVLARISVTCAIGALTGAVIGGAGGRLAMLVLRLTSDPSLHGRETDDGFTIGVISGATLFLVGLTAFLGVAGALVYAATRSWVPARLRPWAAAVVAGAVGGAEVIRPDGIDFTLLEPLPLAVAMYVALPAAYGAALSVLLERSFARPAPKGWPALLGLVLLTPFVLTGLRSPVEIALGGLALAAAFLFARSWLEAVWTSRPVTWLARAGILAVTALAVVVLIGDIADVLA
jgi:hypothetical protein